MKKTWLNLLLVVALLLVSATPAFAQEPDALPDSVPDHAQTDDTVPDPLPDGYTGAPDGFVASTTLYVPLATTDDASAYVTLEEVEVQSAAATELASAAQLALPEPVETTDVNARVLSDSLTGLTGRMNVVVRLSNPAVTEAVAAAGEDAVVAAETQEDVQRAAISQQDTAIAWIKAKDPSATVVAKLQVALNAIIFNVDAAQLATIAEAPGVVSVNRVVDYERDLEETVPWVGGAAVHAKGNTGAGVVVAVLDSGIDYTHYNLFGEGTLEQYAAAYADPASRDGLFPTDKVIEGYDFVGEEWPNAVEVSDPDPIDAVGEAPLAGGHGTHVADIIAGRNGMAPDAKLLAVKVCSAVSSSCSGVALLQGVEYALDPNGDGRIWDAADIINLSLGSSYGQKQDDLTLALQNATNAGAVVVASAGNSGNKPYVVGSPSIAPGVISVAQTTQPSASMDFITTAEIAAPAALVAQPFADKLTSALTAPLGSTAGEATVNQQLACEPLTGDYTGQIVLISRGTCAVSLKFEAAANAGAIVAIVYDNAAGSVPPTFSYGGGAQTIPAYTMTRADGLAFIGKVGQPATIDPANALSLAGSMAASSSRGPSYSFQTIKPDIGAPGAAVSAESGTGTGTTAFGGTSGAAPVVSGAAALLLSASPHLRPYEVRALLMNNADTQVYMNQFSYGDYLAPITRIGAGEVRVDDALEASVIAYEKSSRQGSLSFGYTAMTRDLRFRTTVEVRNYSNQTRTFYISRATRYANDAWGPGGSFAVNIQAPREVRVPARGRATFDVSLYVYARNLPTWTLDGGANGGNGDLLDLHEFDGYITLTERGRSGESLSLPWQILPRKAAELTVRSQGNFFHRSVKLVNTGAADGNAEIFALTGTSPRIPKRYLPGMGDNFAVVDLQAVGFRTVDIGGGLYGLQIGLTTYGTRSHPAYPAEFDVYFDVNNDGVDDYVAFNYELGGFAASGQTVIGVMGVNDTSSAAYFYADADLNSANMIMTVPLFAIGADPSTQMRVSVYAFDNYFTGNLTDSIEDMVLTPGLPKYGPLTSSGAVAPGRFYSFTPQRVSGGAAATPSQQGFLLLYQSQKAGYEADIIKVR